MNRNALALGFTALAVWYWTRPRASQADVSGLVAQGARGSIGDASWEVYQNEQLGGFGYTVSVPNADSDEITEVAYTGEPFGNLGAAIEAAENEIAMLCDSPIFDCDFADSEDDISESEDENPFEPDPDTNTPNVPRGPTGITVSG